MGLTYTCCWPCACDLMELIWVDTKSVTTLDGPRTYDFLVMGDPCSHPEKLEEPVTDPIYGYFPKMREAMPEVYCTAGRLAGATLSDHWYPIIGMFFGDGSAEVAMN